MCDSVASSSVTSEKPPGWTIEAWREFGDVINNALIADDTDFSDHQVTPANDMSCQKLAVLETMDIDANKTSVIEKSKIPNNILDNVCHDCFGKKEKTVSVLDNLDMSNNGPPTAKINEKFCGVENREQTKIKNDISLQEEVILEVMDVDGNINCTIENNCRIPVVVVSELLKLNIEEEYTVLGENKKAYSPVNILSETNIPGEVNHDSSTKNLHIVNGADYLVVSDNEKSGVRSNEGFHETENEDPNNITQNNDKKLTKKRRSNPQHWKQNERKVKRQRGEEYTNVKGANVPRRTVSEKMCHSNADCPFKCALKISQEERELIHSSFWKLNDEKKVHFYSKHIKRYVALRKRTKNEVSKKTFSYKYTFIVSGVCLQVCQEYFLNTLNISKQRVYYFFKNNVDSSTGIPRTPIQGKHPKKSISEERKNEVRDHIKSFPTVPSHYCRASTNKQYLERNLSMKRMYELYFQSTEDPVKFNIYEHIFKTEFNISFFKPKKDICDKCAEHEMLKNPTPVQTEVFEKHINRKNIGNKERNSDRTRHENDNTVGVLTFDLQNTFSLPKSNVSKNFYKMKLCCYNFTAHLNVSNKIYNAIWHEFLCGRAGIHIASAMIRILKAVIEDNPQLQKLILWSDSCVPQNKNSIMSFALQHFLKTKEAKNLEVIEQKFGEPGHGNVQEIDNAHSCIERYLRNLDIWSPLTLIRLLLKIPGTWKLKFRITQMLPKDYLDYQSFSARYTYNSVPYTKVKQLIYDKNEPLNIKYRESFEGKFITTKLRYARRINLKSELEFPDNVPQIALKQVVVPEQKKKHLLEMLPQMPEEERLFYSDLLGLKRVKKQ